MQLGANRRVLDRHRDRCAAQALRILREYERGVIFRLGKLVGARDGLIFLWPFIDTDGQMGFACRNH